MQKPEAGNTTLVSNWKVPKISKKRKRKQNSGVLLHAVFILSSRSGVCGGSGDTVTPLAPFPSCQQELSKTQCPMQRIVKCVCEGALRGRIRDVYKHRGSLGELASTRCSYPRVAVCVLVSARSGKGHEICICYRSPLPTGLEKCL